MKNKRHILFFFLFLGIQMSAQDKVNPNGHNSFHYPDGSISSEGYMKNGKPTGYWKSFYPDGVVRSEGNREGEQLDSLWKFYDRAGNLQKVIDYRNGLKSGYFMQYKLVSDSVTGRNVLVSKELYIEDKLHGLSYYYDDDGVLFKTTVYEKGRKHGTEKHFDKDGNITAILRYSYDNLLSSEIINQYNEAGEKTGIWKEFYPDGQLKSFSNYSEGKLEGHYREYSPIGLITKQNFYKDGEERKDIEKQLNQKAEIVVETHDDGSIKSKGAYKDEKPVGIHREYDKDGNVTTAYEYDENSVLIGKGVMTNEGKRIGKWEFYFPDGKIKSKGIYKDGKRSGEWLFFFADGNREQVGEYKDGKPEGNWLWFYPDGTVRRKGFFVKGKEQGLFTEFSVNGDTLSVGKYVYGLKMEKWKQAVNDYTETGEYGAGKKTGLWEHFYADETLAFKGEYRDGYPDGEHRYYYPNGIIKMKANYSLGVPDGVRIKYDVLGVPETEYFYRSGTLERIDGKKIKEE